MVTRNKVIVFDLDDTLYKEIDYLKSAYHEITDWFRDHYEIYGLWGEMLRYYREKKDVFQEIINFYKRPVDKKFLLDMYRAHQPDIHLDNDTRFVLDYLKNNEGYYIAIITDGRSQTQRNKIKVLGLNLYLGDETDMLVSEEHGHEKPDRYAYEMIEAFFPNCSYTYVGDNPEKDFLAPNQLGWNTICLLDDGRNIHKQDFNLPKDYLPNRRIGNMKDIIGYI
jgi:putative hydrolase of the HAD superfamily